MTEIKITISVPEGGATVSSGAAQGDAPAPMSLEQLQAAASSGGGSASVTSAAPRPSDVIAMAGGNQAGAPAPMSLEELQAAAGSDAPEDAPKGERKRR
jgi:hypothetical protein